MKRRFRIDASQKIQASPVDFGMFDAIKNSNNPEEIKAVLEANKESLETYYIAKAQGMCDDINSDIRKILDNYVGRDNFDAFLDRVDSCEVPKPQKSEVLDHLYYDTDSDDCRIFVMFNPGIDVSEVGEDDEFSYPDVTFCYFADDELDFLWDNLEVSCPDETFVSFLIALMQMPDFITQVSADDVVDTCQRLIYEFVQVADTTYSGILEKATTDFLKSQR